MSQSKQRIRIVVLVLVCLGCSPLFAASEGDVYRTKQTNDTPSYRATSPIAEPENATIGGNVQHPVDTTIYVLKRTKRNAMGGSAYQNNKLKQYLGLHY